MINGTSHTDSVSDSISKTLTHGFSDSKGISKSKTYGTNESDSRGRSLSAGVNESDAYTAGEAFNLVNTKTMTDTFGTSRGITLNAQNMTLFLAMQRLQTHLERIEECESFGMWNFAAYFIGETAAETETAANTYKSVIAGTDSGIERNAIYEVFDYSLDKEEVMLPAVKKAKEENDVLLHWLIKREIEPEKKDEIVERILKSNAAAKVRKDLIINIDKRNNAYEWAVADFIKKNYDLSDVFRDTQRDKWSDLSALSNIMISNLQNEFAGFDEIEMLAILYYVCRIEHELYPKRNIQLQLEKT